MKVSIWWLLLAFYMGLFGGVLITVCCSSFKKSGNFKMEEHHV